MKLLYCIPALHNTGGMERVLTEKVNYLAQLPNYEVFVLTTDHMGRPIRFVLDSRIHVIHLDIDFESHFNVGLLGKYFLHKEKLTLYQQRLKELLIQHNIDVCVSLCGKEIDFLSKLNVGCKKIAETHFALNFRKQFLTARHNTLFWKILGTIRTYQLIWAVKGLDKLVVLTQVDKEQWEKFFSNVIQIRNPNPFESIERSELKKKNVISVGRLDPQKGYDMLIDAWKIVLAKYPDWSLNIWGQGDSSQTLQNRINCLNIEDGVKLRGVSLDIVAEYLNSSIYVMSSRYEGLPMVLIEAMSCGLPIVSFDCECGPREIITDGVDGYLVEVNNIQSLADKMSILIDDENLRTEMGKNALLKSKQFSIEQIMPKWVSLFEELAHV